MPLPCLSTMYAPIVIRWFLSVMARSDRRIVCSWLFRPNCTRYSQLAFTTNKCLLYERDPAYPGISCANVEENASQWPERSLTVIKMALRCAVRRNWFGRRARADRESDQMNQTYCAIKCCPCLLVRMKQLICKSTMNELMQLLY